MAVATPKKITPTEYLAQEKQADTKTELIGGELFPMAGASINHNRIVGQLHKTLAVALTDLNYDILVSDMRVWIASIESYVYPDVVVVKGDPIFVDDNQMELTNPCLIAEVLSPSTERYDKKAKFSLYKTLPSLDEYLIISQTEYYIEQYRRLKTNQWLFTEFSSENDVLSLECLGLEIQMKDLYQRVRF